MRKANHLILATAALLLLAAHPAQAHRGHFGGGIWVGPTWPAFVYPAPIYTPPPVIVREAPQPIYLQPQQTRQYWYYCREAEGYYPYVKNCPGGWQKVVPAPGPPDGGRSDDNEDDDD